MADQQDQEKTYEVKDKRRVSADGTLKEEPPAQESAEPEAQVEAQKTEQPAEQPAEAAGQEAEAPLGEMPVPSVYETLQFAVGLLSEQAWHKMGIRLMPGQKDAVKDLPQAKIAIDTIAFIADKLHAHMSDDERRAMRALVSDLQVNFVRQST